MEKVTNSDEFCIKNYTVSAGKDVSFYSHVHTSWFRVTFNTQGNNKYAAVVSTKKSNALNFNVGGTYNIYINAKTYEVRLELLNPETAEYSCIAGKDFTKLDLQDETVPYVFTYRVTLDEPYAFVPTFYSENYKKYELSCNDQTLIIDRCFIKAGTFNLIINLKEFTLDAELLSN